MCNVVEDVPGDVIGPVATAKAYDVRATRRENEIYPCPGVDSIRPVSAIDFVVARASSNTVRSCGANVVVHARTRD